MSKTDSQNSGNVEIKQTVQIVGYAPDGYGDIREWADAFDDTHDYYATEIKSEKEYSVMLDGEELSIRTSDAKKLAERDTGDIEVTVDEFTKEEFVVEQAVFAEWVRSDFMQVLPDEMMGWRIRRGFMPQYKDENNNKRVKIYRRVGKGEVLKLGDDRTEDDMYDDSYGERPYIVFRPKYWVQSEDQLEELDIRITERAISYLQNHSAIGPVRVEECQKKKTSSGSCTNI